MSEELWKPDHHLIQTCQMTHFMRFVEARFSIKMTHYPELYAWSIHEPEQFWSTLADFTKVNFSKPPSDILLNKGKMPGAKWFHGATLNFAENLLRDRSEKSAIIYQAENGERITVSYSDLYLQVEKIASSLREMGVKKNDRVAGFLPNRPETIIAMLATISIGAIWSSCSPDFGYHGVYDRLEQIQPKVLFFTDGHFYGGKMHSALEKVSQLLSTLPSIEQSILIPNIRQGLLSQSQTWESLLTQSARPLVFEQSAFDHPIYIMFSSGTTGKPKCITHGAGGTLLQHLKEHQLHTNLTPDDIFTYFTTCGWMMWNWLVSGLATGATLLLYDGSPLYPKSSRLFDLIDQEKISIFGTSAKYISAVEKSGLIPKNSFSLSSLKTILSTGSPLSPQNFQYVYEKVKPTVQLCSISGGTDIISCFALGNPLQAIHSGELQCRGLGMKVEIFNAQGKSVRGEKGELVCTAPFPAMPVFFWNDPEGEKYQNAYFSKFPNVWSHGDFAKITEYDGVIIYGRSDTVLNPGGVRIGTAEIYRQVEAFSEIDESIVIGQPYRQDERVILFVKMHSGCELSEDLKKKIRFQIKNTVSSHHVPKKIIAVPDIPRTVSGKISELAVKQVVSGESVKNLDALSNPEALEFYKNIEELGSE